MISSPSLLAYPWLALGLVWLTAAAGKKAVLQRQPVSRRLVHFALATLAFALLVYPWFQRGWLGMRFAPHTQGVYFTGFAISIAGALFAIWARLKLGGNWSGRPSLMAGHELITSGPYALARHPIYTGLVLAFAGTVLALGEWRGVLGVFLVLLAFLIKIRDEEQLMLQAFPDAYPQYRRRVKALIPGVL
jgi:protein-S-isoprenylcysteine O-methyltransferase Ste14